MKRIIILLCTVMLVALSGCSSSAQQNSGTVASSQIENDNQQNIGEENKTGNGDEISIEEIYCSEEQDNYKNYELKVRNNLDIPVDGIRIQCKLIDEAGDSIDSFEWLFTDIDAGKAEQAQHQINDSNGYRLKDAYAFKLYSFKMVNRDPGETLVEAEFSEPIIFKLSEIPGK